MELASVVERFGLAIGLLIYFIWRDYQTGKEHKADMRDIAIKSVQAIDKGTDAINDNTVEIKKNTSVISDNSDTLNQVKGVLLDDRSTRNGNGR